MATSDRAPAAPRWNDQGLAPAIVQHADTGEVLMLGWVNAEALARTLETGLAWFWSRSRGRLWQKGETSGHVITVSEVRLDCDGDALLYRGLPTGPTCHTGHPSCFFSRLTAGDDGAWHVEPAPGGTSEHAPAPAIIDEVYAVVRQRQRDLPEGSYTAYLFKSGVDKIGKKIGEEAAEVIIAAKNGEAGPLALETADLLYHALVMLAACGVDPALVWAELAKRRR